MIYALSFIIVSLHGMEYKLIKLPEREQFAQFALDAGFSEHFLEKTNILRHATKQYPAQTIWLHIGGACVEYLALRKKYTTQDFLEIIAKTMFVGKYKLLESFLKEYPDELKRLKDEGYFICYE